jgi:single-stranded DNA-binding protein
MAKSNSFTVYTDVKVVNDAESREIGDKTLVSFNIADNSSSERDTTKFVRVTVSGKLAEVLAELKKGDRVNVVGKETFRLFDKKDGSQGYAFDVQFPMSVTRVFVDGPRKTEAAEADTVEEAPKPRRGRPPKAKVDMPWDADD